MLSEVMSSAIELYIEAECLLQTLGDTEATNRISALLKAKTSGNDAVAYGYVRGIIPNLTK
jgi:hypothetical protein